MAATAWPGWGTIRADPETLSIDILDGSDIAHAVSDPLGRSTTRKTTASSTGSFKRNKKGELLLRIGLIGTENSHADHVIRHVNIEGRHQNCRVTTLAGGKTDRNIALATQGQIDDIVGSAEEIADRVDAAFVMDRHGGLHVGSAEPLLESGKHVFVDKPMATTVADAKRIVAAAEHGGGVLASWSAIRFVPAIIDITQAAADLGELAIVSVTGPADPNDPHAGLFFYGPHVIEPALEILGNPTATDVQVQKSTHSVTATAQANDVELVFHFVQPDHTRWVGWQISAAHRRGIMTRNISLKADYLAAGTAHFLDAVRTGSPPMPYDRLIAPIELLQTITSQLGALSQP